MKIYFQEKIMTKADMVTAIAEGSGMTKVQAEKAINLFISTTISALKAEDKVSLIGFGTFSAVTRPARTGRNPQTGAEMQIAAKTSGKFTPGSSLKNLFPAPVAPVAPVVAAKPAKCPCQTVSPAYFPTLKDAEESQSTLRLSDSNCPSERAIIISNPILSRLNYRTKSFQTRRLV
jgi:DNA-binding protein HU-beta